MRGAVPDGITDNTVVIQEIIDELALKGGGTVFFNNKGTYLFDQLVIKTSVRFKGEGANSTVLQSKRINSIIKSGEEDKETYWFGFSELRLHFPNLTGTAFELKRTLRYSFEDCQLEGSKALLLGKGIETDGSEHGYYGTFTRTNFAYFDVGVNLKNSANAHRFFGCWFYHCNIGAEIADSNGNLFIGCTFQDFQKKGVSLIDSGLGANNRNSFVSNYFEAIQGGTEVETGIDIGVGVKSTSLISNLYNQIRPQHPEVIDNGTRTMRLEYNTTSSLETLKLPYFVNLLTHDKSEFTTALKQYEHSFSFGTKSGEKDDIYAYISNDLGTPVRVKIPYVYQGVLDLIGTKMNGVTLIQYADNDITLGTKAEAAERHINYDMSFKMPRFHDGSGWRYVQGIRNGHTSTRPVGPLPTGFSFFDTGLSKPIWWTGSKWVDSAGATV